METVESWCRAYVASTSLAYKLAPPPLPDAWEHPSAAEDPAPGRPPELEVTLDKPHRVKPGALASPEARGRLVHKFWHHELQAAELMAWAVLRFPQAEPEFKRGLVRVARDEIRHMGMYGELLTRTGHRQGSFPVRDWFWERTRTCESVISFVAFIGMGLEGANLDHTERFAGWFRLVGENVGADIIEQVGREEVAHVRFATRWFRSWTGNVDFDAWVGALPPPMTPLVLRGKTLQRAAREKAEMPDAFLDRLEAWEP